MTSAYIDRGFLYYQLGQTQKALADYNQAIQLNPKSANAHYNRGLLYRELRDTL